MEDVAEARSDHRADAPALQRPHGALARRAAAEVLGRHQDPRLPVGRPVQDELGVLGPVRPDPEIVEAELAVALAPRLAEEPRGDHAVGVDVRQVKRRGDAVRRVKGCIARRSQAAAGPSRRTSVSRPVTAAAAAIVGLMRWVRAPGPLPALEVPVGGRRDALARAGQVAIHRDAHRAAGLAPLEAGVAEDAVESLGLGGAADQSGARARPSRAPRPDAPGRRRRRAQVLEPAVGARPDEDAVDPDGLERRAGRESHVGERPLEARRAGPGRPAPPGRARRRRSGPPSSGLVPQVTMGATAEASIVDLTVEARIGIGRERAPLRERAGPDIAPRGASGRPSRYA